MIRLLLSVIGLVATIIFHQHLFNLGINARLSFTWSMIIPYVIEFFFIASITFQLYMQLLAEKPMPIRRIIGLISLIGGCGIAFAFNPIYEGDFNHQYREVLLKGNNEAIFQEGLTMVAMPGCPFCYLRTEELQKMKNIYPELNARILVINQDTMSVNDYQELAGANVTVGFFPNELIQTLQIDGFPTFYYKEREETKPMVNWTNRGFGSAAWDYVLKREKEK